MEPIHRLVEHLRLIDKCHVSALRARKRQQVGEEVIMVAARASVQHDSGSPQPNSV
jgi:hypothetical protein